jgi:hypothetical protein
MKVSLSRPAVAAATLGAVGLAIFPFVLQRVDARAANALVALWLFGLAAVDRSGAVVSLAELDDWGHTVLQRAVRATWLLWGLLLSLHVVFWSTQYRVELVALAPIGAVLLTRRIRTEARLWWAVVATLVIVGLKLPAAFSVTALGLAGTLALRAAQAARSSGTAAVSGPPGSIAPYRMSASDEIYEATRTSEAAVVVVADGRAAMGRLLAGAVVAFYLSVWTLGWSSGPWPAHMVWLDVLLTVVVSLGAQKLRIRAALAPLAVGWIHFVVQARLVPAPRSLTEWGGASIVLGFALLVASLAASYWLRPNRRARRAAG